MKWRTYVGVLLLALVYVVLFGATAGAQEQSQGQRIVTVSILDSSFEPARPTVEPGTIVEWVNEGKSPHTVTSTDDGPLSSKTLQPGEAYRFTFQEPDMIREYHSELYPDKMSGSVKVRAAGEDVKQFGTRIPDTGGPPLVLPASLALIATGVAGFILTRRNKASHLK